MKNFLLVVLVCFATQVIKAQEEGYTPGTRDFNDKPHMLLFESGTFTCWPCYSWTNPTFDYFKAAYGDSLILMKQELNTSFPVLASSVSSLYTSNYNLTPYGYSWGSPTLWLNQRIRFLESDSIYRVHMHATMDSILAQPVIASPLFYTERIGTDSLVVHTYTKFLQNAPAGDYRVTVLLLQDSIYFNQTGAPGGMTYHMNVLHGPNLVWSPSYTTYDFQGEDSLNYTLANGAVSANSIVSKTFHFKLDTSIQHMNHIRPLVLITLFDTAAQTYDCGTQSYVTYPRHIYVNATVKEWDTTSHPTSVTALSAQHQYLTLLYPNPVTNGSAKVLLQGVKGTVTLTIFDAMGRTVRNLIVNNGDVVSLQGLATGKYIYHFSKGSQIIGTNSLIVGE